MRSAKVLLKVANFMINGEVKLRNVRNRKEGFYIMDDMFIDTIARHCKPPCSSVYNSLCRHANLYKQTCFPSKKLIAEENGMGVRTVGNSIKKLEKLGLILIWQSRKRDGSYNNNLYTLLDITKWKYKPEANVTKGTKIQLPKARESKNHGHEMPNKDINNKDINNKEDTPFLKAIRARRLQLGDDFSVNEPNSV